MIRNNHNTTLHEKSWVESGQNHKTVTGLVAQKMVANDGTQKWFS